MSLRELAAFVDDAILNPALTPEEVAEEVSLAVKYGCATACVNPCHVALAASICGSARTGVSAVVDFPFGCSSIDSKAFEADAAIRAGAREVDVVANYGLIRAELRDAFRDHVASIVKMVHANGCIVKIILETDSLRLDQISWSTRVVADVGADFAKTSTGFYTGETQRYELGASDEVLSRMMQAVRGGCKVKASGHVRTLGRLSAVLDAGAGRVGIGCGSIRAVMGAGERS